MVDASTRGSICLFNMLSTRYLLDTYYSYLFSKHLKFFFAKIPLSATRHQITYFLRSLEENECACIKYPINMKHPKKLLLMRILIYWNSVGLFFFFFFDFKMSLFKLKSPSFLNKRKMHTLQIFKNPGWHAWLTFWSIYKIVSNVVSLWFQFM